MALEYLKTNILPFSVISEEDNAYILSPNFNEFSLFGYLPEEENTLDFLLELLNRSKWAKEVQSSKQELSKEEVLDDFGDVSDNNSSEILSTSEPSTSLSSNMIGNFNVSKALSFLNDIVHYDLNYMSLNVKKKPKEGKHRCARAVRMAMEAGGLNTTGRPEFGGDYGPYLVKHGWKQLPSDTTHLAGDICVTHGLGKKGRGHIAMYDGRRWISDFILNSWKVWAAAKEGTNTHFYRYTG